MTTDTQEIEKPKRGKPKNVIQTVSVPVQLPVTLKAEMDLLLYSDVQEKVPFGVRSKFIETAIRKHLDAIKAGMKGQSHE